MVYYIYKIVNIENSELCYVGQTKCFNTRRATHKSSVAENPGLLYKTIRDNGGWENWNMTCIEVCPEEIDTKRKAEAREETWRQKLSANLNNNRCFITEEQKKEYYNTYSREYRDKNAEYYRNYSREYRKNNPDYFTKWRQRNPEYHNEWRRQNDDFVMCACGRQVNKLRMHLHEKTKLHAKGLALEGLP